MRHFASACYVAIVCVGLLSVDANAGKPLVSDSEQAQIRIILTLELERMKITDVRVETEDEHGIHSTPLIQTTKVSPTQVGPTQPRPAGDGWLWNASEGYWWKFETLTQPLIASPAQPQFQCIDGKCYKRN